MGINKVNYGATVLIDLTQDTVAPQFLKHGIVAHDNTGATITGESDFFPLDPEVYDYNIGYISNGSWIYENPTNTYTDIYEARSGHTYIIALGANVGSRFRAMFTTTDIRTVSSGNISGTSIINLNNPPSYRNVSFTCTADGYILVAKDNVGKSGVMSYVFDLTPWD